MKELVYTKAKTDLSEMAKRQFNFRFDEDLIKLVQKLADKDNRSLTNYIETVLSQKVEEEKAKKKPR